MSPTARALAVLKQRGWTAGVVEKHLQYPKPFGKKHDFLGVIDVIACCGYAGVLGIQITSMSNTAARIQKALDEPRLRDWLACTGATFQVWGLSKRRVGKRLRWTLRIKRVYLVYCPVEKRKLLQVSEWSEPELCA